MAAAGRERRPLDPLVWKACAGSSVRIPAVGSVVYYFPQGHAEQASAAPDFSLLPRETSYLVCRLAGKEFLANHDTDEVYTRMTLETLISPSAADSVDSSLEDAGEADSGVVSFAKMLTPSDANNGGGFSVPRFCADSILPPLNYNDEPPVQTLRVMDVHGTAWEFRHIYRGTPRRHLLTTGWSKFVSSKKLVAGDSVIFVKNGSAELFVGVRRAARSAGPSDSLYYPVRPQVGPPSAALPATKLRGEGFSRNCRGRGTPEAVVEAVRLAAMGCPFDVVYYPRVGSPDFVVRKEVVDAALRALWPTGTRVKMAVETEVSSRMTWFQGSVSCIVRNAPPFTYSPWRTLEVTWDDPDVFQNVKRVSPWQLELVSASPQILTPYPMVKKLRTTQNHELLTDAAEKNMFLPMSEFSCTAMESINPLVFDQNTFPAGMQGARHDQISFSSLSNLIQDGIHQKDSETLNVNNIPPKPGYVSTALNIGCALQSESSSPPSQNSVYCCGSGFFSNSAVIAPSKVINGSFQLFGKIIQMGQPVVVDVKEGYSDNLASVSPYNVSLSSSQKQFPDKHEGPPQRVPALET